jgi:hypothetical protein
MLLYALFSWVFLFAQALAAIQATDPKTGISFSQWSASGGFSFGIALPPSPKSDFIGKIVRFCIYAMKNDKADFSLLIVST